MFRDEPFFRCKGGANAVTCSSDGSRLLCASGGIKMSRAASATAAHSRAV